MTAGAGAAAFGACSDGSPPTSAPLLFVLVLSPDPRQAPLHNRIRHIKNFRMPSSEEWCTALINGLIAALVYSPCCGPWHPRTPAKAAPPVMQMLVREVQVDRRQGRRSHVVRSKPDSAFCMKSARKYSVRTYAGLVPGAPGHPGQHPGASWASRALATPSEPHAHVFSSDLLFQIYQSSTQPVDTCIRGQ